MERFVKMLKKGQIIVIESDKYPRSKNYNCKFIGADCHGRWDFTPLVAEFSGRKSSNGERIMFLSVFCNDPIAAIADTLLNLKKKGITGITKDNYALYEEVRDHVCTFYM